MCTTTEQISERVTPTWQNPSSLCAVGLGGNCTVLVRAPSPFGTLFPNMLSTHTRRMRYMKLGYGFCLLCWHSQFEYLPEQADFILHYAISGSVVVRSIRKLDGQRSTSLIFKSLRFPKEKYIGACSFVQESDFTSDLSESEYAKDSIISQESTPLPTFISEFDDHNIRNISQKKSSKLEDEAARSRS